MIDPYTDELIEELTAFGLDEPSERESLRCDDCGTLIAGIAQLLDHYDRRH